MARHRRMLAAVVCASWLQSSACLRLGDNDSDVSAASLNQAERSEEAEGYHRYAADRGRDHDGRHGDGHRGGHHEGGHEEEGRRGRVRSVPPLRDYHSGAREVG
eukprot:TRINITY_DN28714_c0_g1_i4.p2 TRINITY_DN28714_c0_g1~~TRINITY_DN28714_c0_g1_i4.p2  ORF type:complete len:104 (-),score=12.41 TRINITY_DN28714_c0_g1_i4:243-554(-)